MIENSSAATQPHFEHVGLVVKDIEETTKLLSAALSPFGIGPWRIQDYSPNKDELLAGEPFKLRHARANLGASVLELHQPVAGKSIWADFLKAHGEGLDHICLSVTNFSEVVSALQAQGHQMIVGGTVQGKHWGYFRLKAGGITIEISEPWEGE